MAGLRDNQKNLLGLRDGEQLASQWNAYYDFDQVFNAAVGMTTRGKHLYVGITNLGRLVIARMEDKAPPMSFERGQVAIQLFDGKAKIGSIAGMQELEKPKVMQFTPAQGSSFRIQIAESAANSLVAWARSQ